MDFNAIIESLTAIVRHSGSAVVVYAVVVCILTEIVKKLFIPKLKIDLLNKFDPTIIVPFALGCAASVFHSLAPLLASLVMGAGAWGVYGLLSRLLTRGGVLATV